MSSGTIPAAAPGTTEPAPATPETPARPGGLTSLMVPVEPARPLDAPTDTDADADAENIDGQDQPVTNGSSSSFHDGDDDDTEDGGSDALKKEKSVWKAFGLAAAQRWAKGGGTANKRLEVAKTKASADKARAAAKQVKTTETVKRAEGPSGGAGGGRAPATGGRTTGQASGGNKSTGAGGGGKPAAGGGSVAKPRNGGGASPSGGRGGSPAPGGGSGAGGGGRSAGKDHQTPKNSQKNTPKGGADKSGARTNSKNNGGATGPKNKGTGPGNSGGKDRPWRDRSATKDTAKPKDKPGNNDGAGKGTKHTPANTNSPKNNGAGTGGGASRTDKPAKTDLTKKTPRTNNSTSAPAAPKRQHTPGGATHAPERPWRNRGTHVNKKPTAPGPSAAAKPDNPKPRTTDTTKGGTPPDMRRPKPPTKTDGGGDKPYRPWHRKTPKPPTDHTPAADPTGARTPRRPIPKNTQGPDDIKHPKTAPTTAAKDQPTAPRHDLTKKPAPKPDRPTPSVNGKTWKTPPTEAKPALTEPKKTNAPAKPAPLKKPLRTKKAREVGYQHGTKAGEAVSQVRAYSDGARDGYRDRTDSARSEKERMDAIHTKRKQDREEKPVTTPAGRNDWLKPPATTNQTWRHPDGQGPAPIAATHANGKIHLGPGTLRSTITGGEVRNVRQYQNRLAEDAQTLQQLNEAAKPLAADIAEMNTRATQLLETAQAMELGDKSVGAISNVHEPVTELASTIDTLIQLMTRGIDQARGLHANVEARYMNIYRAAVDSEEAKPANHMRFYTGKGTA